MGHIDPHAFGSEGTQKLHAGEDESHSPFEIRALRMVDGNAYLQDAFVEVPYFPLLMHPDFFQRFMTVVAITPVELPDAFDLCLLKIWLPIGWCGTWFDF